jgi:hypothetical protein
MVFCKMPKGMLAQWSFTAQCSVVLKGMPTLWSLVMFTTSRACPHRHARQGDARYLLDYYSVLCISYTHARASCSNQYIYLLFHDHDFNT